MNYPEDYILHVTSYTQLDQLAAEHSHVLDVLEDASMGRYRASEALRDMGLVVSEKLIRTWREKAMQSGPAETVIQNSIIRMTEHELQNPFIYRIPDEGTMTRPVTYTTTTIGQTPKPKTVSKKDKDQRVIAFGDFQINKHDPDLLEKAVQLVKDQQPDMICLTGDESDNSAVGRWAKGMKEEFESNLQDQIDETIDWLTDIREAAPNARIWMAHSNHMNWVTKAIETRLPGFQTLRALTPEKLYELEELEIEYQRKIVEFLPNFLLAHGHQWNLSSTSHRTKGIEHVLRTGCSILAGHVHQAALETVFVGYEGKGEQKVYINPGCMMDFDKAMESNGGYISGTSPNWSKGIAVITRQGGQNFSELILADSGNFRYEGKLY